ncbi:hypothetical protein Ddc_12916 [Ditylenchus destructor]|nr:hypothetical protein Ddc_12916 [Ditylenchus destructor]
MQVRFRTGLAIFDDRTDVLRDVARPDHSSKYQDDNEPKNESKSEKAGCPQAYWDSLMEMHITDGNATASANDILTAFQTRYPGRPFYVTCTEKKVNPLRIFENVDEFENEVRIVVSCFDLFKKGYT